MPAAFAEALRGELAALEAELERDPRLLKIKHLRDLIDLYEAAPQQGSGLVLHPIFAPARKPMPPVRGKDPKREAVLDAVQHVLREMGDETPIKTGEIFELLPQEVIDTIPGREPKSNLSAMMHNSKRFVSHGRDGWSLPESAPEPVSQPTPRWSDPEVEALTG